MIERSEDEIWNYQQIDLGFNYRMNDIQAVLGLSQLKRVDQYVRHRREIAKFYNYELKNLPITIPFQAPYSHSSYHLYPILIKNENNLKTQKQIFNELRGEGIAANLHYTPVHRHPYYEKLGFKKNDFPIAEDFHKKAISIPIYPTLTDQQKDHVVKTLKKVMSS